MSIWSRVKQWTFGDGFSLELKKAFDAVKIGIAGRPAYPDHDQAAMFRWQRRNELVYACIKKKAEALCDPEIVVQKKNSKGDWEEVPGHPLVALLNKPNPRDSGSDFRKALVASENIAGEFYAEIVRSGAGIPVELYPLNPVYINPVPDNRNGIAYFEFNNYSAPPERLQARDVLFRKQYDLTNPFHGLAPLEVALGSVDADTAKTDYVRAFFNSDGTPTGLLKYKNRTLTKEEAEHVQELWKAKYSRGGRNQKGIAVLDDNADFQKIGANLNELESDSLDDHNETRICMVFGVPPILVGAASGLRHVTQNATAKVALGDFWLNTMSPELKNLREWLTWSLLPEFEDIEQIKKGNIRVFWDTSHVLALQEDLDKVSARAERNFKAAIWSWNEAREATGQKPDPKGDFFLIPSNAVAVTLKQIQEVFAGQLEMPRAQAPMQITDGNPDAAGDQKKTLSEADAETKAAEQTEEDAPAAPEGTAPIGLPQGADKETERKSYDHEGLTLSRKPTELEASLDLKGMVSTLETEQGKISEILNKLRDSLIEEAVSALESADPATAHALTLTPDPKAVKKIRKALESAYQKGREQVASELNKQRTAKGLEPLEIKRTVGGDTADEQIVSLADSTVSRIVNRVQATAIDLYAQAVALKQTVTGLGGWLREKLIGQSSAFVDQTAKAAANSAIQTGRAEEMEAQKDGIEMYEYSAILDANLCDPCSEWDGEQADSLDKLPSTPYSGCEGGSNCRCMIIAIYPEA